MCNPHSRDFLWMCGVLGNRLIGPFVFDNNLTGNIWSLPEAWVTKFVGRHPVNDKEPNVLPTWWGSATLHSARTGVLKWIFSNRWLGRGGPIAWPPRSPDLTPMDYYLGGHMKTLVYETKVDSRAALRRRVFAAVQHIRNHPNNISSATESLLIRAENCIATAGGHLKQVL